MNDTRLTAWMARYVRAWNSNEPADIEALFTDGAVYLTEPYAKPWHGRDAIVRGWLDSKDEPGQTTFRWEPLAVHDDICFIQGRTEYHVDPPRAYHNLWVIRLDDEGRCTEFTEWWMKEPLPG
ncbi:nuclear transport factor 2 family protein [Georgenia yuyongxinii]